MFYIYKIGFEKTSKVYIGRTCDIHRRCTTHKWSANNGSNNLIHRAMRKYGIENAKFEVIATCLKDEYVSEVEIRLIEQYDSFNNGYNMTPGGDGAGKGNKHHNYGKHWSLSEKTKDKMLLSHLKRSKESYYNIDNKLVLNKNHKEFMSDEWKIYFKDKSPIIVKGLAAWGRDNGYFNLWSVYNGDRKRSKNITKIEKVSN